VWLCSICVLAFHVPPAGPDLIVTLCSCRARGMRGADYHLLGFAIRYAVIMYS
jgi:hypothetical protein